MLWIYKPFVTSISGVEQSAALTNEILSRVDNPDAFTVLIRRYVNDLPFKRIARQLHFSEAQVFIFTGAA